MKRKTLLLINPANQLRQGFLINRATRNQPLSLGIIAALTPPDWKIKILDENFRAFKYYEADLVGITAFTSTAPRAYEIAAIYRAKGIKTVMGGIHASMVPEEAMQYVDAVVEGEAEPVWAQVIADYESGSLKNAIKARLRKRSVNPNPAAICSIRDIFVPEFKLPGVVR